MSIRVQIQCINKTNRYSAHERIHKFGGVVGNARWSRTQDEMIHLIESGQNTFFVQKPGYLPVDVIISRSSYGNKYLKTVSDGEQPNNLLSLPECP